MMSMVVEYLPAVTSFFFTDTPTTPIYTLSLHDALPISGEAGSSATDITLGTDNMAEDMIEVMRGAAGHLDHVLGHVVRSEEHTSELQSPYDLVCRLLLEKKKKKKNKLTQFTAAELDTHQ